MPKVLVTGANGMLGQDLCPILEDEGYEVIETDIQNLDITNPGIVNRVLNQEKPDIVIHCAAYTNVDKAEEDIDTARLINAKGTENIAKVCSEIDAVLVYISTDYVFNGGVNVKRTEPYMPFDETDPLNNYGLTKWEGEEAVRKHCKKYFITRTSWLYGIHGKNFVETMISLADKPELKVVDDQIGCPTWTVELSNGIAKLLKGSNYGTYHVCGSGKTSWYGFAKEIFNLAGLNVNLKPCTTDEFPRPAKRPYYSVMDNNKICRDWKIALKDYINLRDLG
ncbi:dTDP-4-dehydrorhamnose reductase [bacterium]|nr:dTDP-4-dehydrorhamnose reductase [bacterium]